METPHHTHPNDLAREFDLANSPLRNGSMLIEASAGTGKTFTLIGLLLRLILQEKYRITELLVVTFTKAATAELREKVRETLNSVRLYLKELEREDAAALPAPDVPQFVQDMIAVEPHRRSEWIQAIDDAIVEFNDVAIRTIHGFCQSVLQEQAFETGALFDNTLLGDRTELLREILLDFWRRTFYPMDRPLAGLLLSEQHTCSGQASKAKLVRSAPFGFDELEKVLSGYGKNPDARLPDSSRVFPSIDAAFAELEELLEEFRRVARSERAELQRVFLDDRAWGTNDYGKNADALNTQRLAQLELCLENPEETGLSDWEVITHFSWGTVDGCTGVKQAAKGAGPPKLTTFLVADRLIEARAKAVLTLKTEFIRYLESEMLVRSEQRNIFTYDTLLTEVDRALQKDTAGSGQLTRRLRERYQVVLIDEFQDTDALQYRIFHTLFGTPDRMMVMVGDPKQSIYRFRGADVNTYLAAAAQAERRFTLAHNYRSDKRLIDAMNTLFKRPQLPFAQPDIDYVEVACGRGEREDDRLRIGDDERPAPLRIGFAMPELPVNKEDIEKWAVEWTIQEIARLIENGATLKGRPVVWSDIAVLTYARKHLRQVQKRLNELGVPSALRTTSSIWETPEAGQLEHVLRAISEIDDASLIRSALTTPLFEVGAENLVELAADEELWECVLEEFREYHDLWEKRGFIQMFNRLMNRRAVRQRFASRLDGLRSLTNFEHLAELLHDHARQEDLGKARLMTWLLEKRRNPGNPDGEDDSERLRIESDEPSLTLMTIHGSKGLQFPIVICPFLWADQAPQKTNQRPDAFYYDSEVPAYFWNLDNDPGPRIEAQLERDKLSENLRLLYVALTRAESQCSFFAGRFLSKIPKGSIYGHCLPYLLNQPAPAENDTAPDALDLRNRAVDGLVNSASATIFSNLREGLLGSDDDADAPIALDALHAPPQRVRSITPRLAVEPEGVGETLSVRKFDGKIRRDWGISSFTSLKRISKKGPLSDATFIDDIADDVLDADADDHEPQATPDDAEAGRDEAADIFLLPTGARTGSMLHDILEKLDFRDDTNWPALVERTLSGYGLLTDRNYAPAILGMLHELMNLPLPSEPGDDARAFRLRDLDPTRVRREMEFSLPLEGFWLPRLKSAFAGDDASPAWWPLFTGKLELLAPRQFEGFLRGFIDLIFEHNGRYYLVDWKSNFLGNTKAAYQSGKLPRVMAADLYVLQYHIYVVAAARYLAQRIPGFSFDKHFGGVFYIFLRGLDSTYPGNGIFFDRPPENRVFALDKILENRGSD